MLENLYIIILNWNLKAETITCIDSVLRAGAVAEHIIVVDNGSNDGSPESIREYFDPPPFILETGKNLGYAGGMNQGIRMGLEYGAKWFLLLNNDTIVDQHMLMELDEASQKVPENTILAPLILNYERPEYINYIGDRRILNTFITHTLYCGESVRKNLPEILFVDFFTGCAILIPAEVFRVIGLFDEYFFMYAEDIDFCWRAQIAGYRLACATHARLRHKVSASTRHDQPRNRYWRISNQINFYRRYSQKFQILIMFLFTVCRSLGITLKDLWHRQPELLVPLWQGFYDGWHRKMGDGTF
jgi:GT2 family glycosyltransferase